MPLLSYSVERYRSFVRRSTVTLRPLTLLFGYNSAGKSALLRALPFLAASVGGGKVGPLALDAEAARQATYKDVASRFASRNELAFVLTWDDDAHPVHEIEIRLREEDKAHLVSEFVARDAGGAQILKLVDVPGERGRYTAMMPGGKPSTMTIPFRDLRPSLAHGQNASKELRGALADCVERLGALQASVHWLGAVRATPRRKDSYRGDPAHLSGTGEESAVKLAYDARKPAGEQKLLDGVSSTLENMFGQILRVRDDGDEFALELEPVRGSPVGISVVDVGEGISQVLPVLLLSAMAAAGDLGPGAVLAIEQPEMHLHPRAERVLAELFGKVIQSAAQPRLVIETHSENLLLSVQLLIATGQIKPEDVSIVWVSALANGEGDLRYVALDEQGRPKDWPAGVFSEAAAIARDLFMARRGESTRRRVHG
ncbi:MAG: AAA family ATPase [Polyangiaceae bacterium]